MVAPSGLAGGHYGQREKRHSLGPVDSGQPMRMYFLGVENSDKRLGENYRAVGAT